MENKKAIVNTKDNFYKMDLKEQEVTINILFAYREFCVYTSRISTYNRLKRDLGAPSKLYYNKGLITGGRWDLSFDEREKIKKVLTLKNLIGKIK